MVRRASELVFLDTGAIYALADRNDLHHASVFQVYGNPAWQFITHDYVLVEAFSLLTKRLHKHAAILAIGALRESPRFQVVSVRPHLLEAAWVRCNRYADKEWDWVDCISFELMEQRGIWQALTLDHHFTQAGFTLL